MFKHVPSLAGSQRLGLLRSVPPRPAAPRRNPKAPVSLSTQDSCAVTVTINVHEAPEAPRALRDRTNHLGR